METPTLPLPVCLTQWLLARVIRGKSCIHSFPKTTGREVPAITIRTTITFGIRVSGLPSPHSLVASIVRMRPSSSPRLSVLRGRVLAQTRTQEVVAVSLAHPLSLALIVVAAGISIESVNWQKHFLVQHEKGELSFAQGDGSDGFKAAATFCLKPGLANTGTGVTMEPLGEPGQYLLHEGYHMVNCLASLMLALTPKGATGGRSR